MVKKGILALGFMAITGADLFAFLGLFEFAFKVCSRAIWYSGYIVS